MKNQSVTESFIRLRKDIRSRQGPFIGGFIVIHVFMSVNTDNKKEDREILHA